MHMEVLHISCNMCTRDLPDMYALRPVALRLWAYISGKSLVSVLQLLHTALPFLDSFCKAAPIIIMY